MVFKLLPIDREVLKLERLIVDFNEWIEKYNNIIVDVFLKITNIEGDIYLPDDINVVLAHKKENIKQELYNRLRDIMNVEYIEPEPVVIKEKKKRVYKKKEVKGENDLDKNDENHLE